MAVISMKQFLDAGVHFGHQTKRWHPKMSPYIYGTKNGVHVIDLRQTLTKLKEAYEYVKASAEEGRVPLFVGTKTQIQSIVKAEANRCGCPYINFRWLGGLLTNFGTVKQSVARMKSFEELAGDDGSYEGFIKKEALMMERKRLKLERSLGGVRNMNSIPSILFITDCHKEQLALKEAQKLGITVVGVSDTNCDPTGIDYVIPGNDDSPRAVALYANVISTAIIEGLATRKLKIIDNTSDKKDSSKKASIVSEDQEKRTIIKQKKTKQTTIKKAKSSTLIKAKNNKEGTEFLKEENTTLLKTESPEVKKLTQEKKIAGSKTLLDKSTTETKLKSVKKKTPSIEKKSTKGEKTVLKKTNLPLSKKPKTSVTENKKVNDNSRNKENISKAEK